MVPRVDQVPWRIRRTSRGWVGWTVGTMAMAKFIVYERNHPRTHARTHTHTHKASFETELHRIERRTAELLRFLLFTITTGYHVTCRRLNHSAAQLTKNCSRTLLLINSMFHIDSCRYRRTRSHNFELTGRTSYLTDCNFITRMLCADNSTINNTGNLGQILSSSVYLRKRACNLFVYVYTAGDLALANNVLSIVFNKRIWNVSRYGSTCNNVIQKYDAYIFDSPRQHCGDFDSL